LSLLVPPRRPARELIDDESLPSEEMARSLQDLERVNARWGGGGALADWLLARMGTAEHRETPPLILDVGAGSGGVSRSVAARLAECGVAAKVVAVDLQWRHLAFGRSRRPDLVALAADAFELPFPDRACDWVVSTLVLHHFSPEENGRLLREIARVARRGFAMLDLRRHLFPWIFVSIAGRIVFESAASKHDGPASVLQAYTPREVEAIARAAVPDARVERVFPYRMLVTGPAL
jgi:ubiquinone/menaquinone biosynthesis C-methylase UbiE